MQQVVPALHHQTKQANNVCFQKKHITKKMNADNTKLIVNMCISISKNTKWNSHH